MHLTLIQGSKISIDSYVLDEGRVDVERFVEETIRDIADYSRVPVADQDKYLVTLLYHLNILPEYIATLFSYRHKFRDCLYSKDSALREKTAMVYSNLLRVTLEQAETLAKDSENPSPLLQNYRFDEMRQMIYEGVVHGSNLAPLLRAAIGLVVEIKQDNPTPEDDGPEFCW